jgi:hypothetical protein
MKTYMDLHPRVFATLPAQEIKTYLSYTLILLVFSWTACAFLLPEAAARFDDRVLVLGPKQWVMAVGGAFTVSILFLGPFILFMTALWKYLAARSLDRLGVITKGCVLQKWIDTVDDKPSYRVSYQFKKDLRAWQTVPFTHYEILAPGQEVEVLYLEKSPHLSRLDIEEFC